MIKAIIIDDEKKCIASLANDLEKYCNEKVQILAKCQSAKEGLQMIKKLNPQLVFLDIEMPWMNGFEMLELIDDINFDIIFTTAYDEFAVKAFRISAVDYLLKPIDKDDLIDAIEKVLQKNASNTFSKAHLDMLLENLKPDTPSKRIAIPTLDGYDLILVDNILYCLAEGSYTHLITIRGKIMVSRSIKEMEELLKGFNFCRIHHSSLINLDHTLKFVRSDGGYVIMSDSKTLSVSRAKKELLLNKIR